MSVICPTITAYEPHEYREQIERLRPFASRIHIDLMDGDFAPTRSPSLEQIWWPHEFQVDIHLMYSEPMQYLDQIIKMHPRMVIVPVESQVHHMHFVAELHKENILAGLAILQGTPVENAQQIMHSFDHVLVFSGNLGYHGGHADLNLLDKVSYIHRHHPDAEIGWDGGINDSNAKQLADGGVDVLNVGGFIQKSSNPGSSYATLLQTINNRDDKA